MKLKKGSLVALLVMAWTIAPLLRADEYFVVDYPPSTVAGELQIGVTHTLWVPRGVKALRGIIVHQHGCGEGACKGGKTAAFDLHWQALAKKWHCALLGPSYHQAQEQNCRLWCDPRNGSGDVFVRAIADLANQSGHPELADAPWCLWGHSGGGFWSSLMQMQYPQRIVAIWFQSGTAFGYWDAGEIEAPEIPELAMHIPMMANPGVKERDHERFQKAWNGSLAMFKAYRARGAPITFAPDPRTGHETGDSRYLAIPFFDACLDQRLAEKPGDSLRQMDPGQAWLAPLLSEEAVVAAEFGGDQSEQMQASWLPNAAVAKAWSEFVKTGAVGDDTPPPAPTGVAVGGGDKGEAVVTWQAEADFESGLRQFVIFRGDREIGRVPEEPKGKFGRPLFQSMTYGDTPEAPLRQMRFVDKATKAAEVEAATYRVIAINSVGLKSK